MTLGWDPREDNPIGVVGNTNSLLSQLDRLGIE